MFIILFIYGHILYIYPHSSINSSKSFPPLFQSGHTCLILLPILCFFLDMEEGSTLSIVAICLMENFNLIRQHIIMSLSVNVGKESCSFFENPLYILSVKEIILV